MKTLAMALQWHYVSNDIVFNVRETNEYHLKCLLLYQSFSSYQTNN